MFKKVSKKINNLNELIAIKITNLFGSMWTAYIFIIYGLSPLLFPSHLNEILYWSNFIQLWALPLIMTGQNILGRSTEQRIKETHDIVMTELNLLKEENKNIKEINQLLLQKFDDLSKKLEDLRNIELHHL